jgi:3-mercaptopyruvate sulfurtransferase SseA
MQHRIEIGAIKAVALREKPLTARVLHRGFQQANDVIVIKYTRTPSEFAGKRERMQFAVAVGHIASADEYEINCGTRAPSAKSGVVLWPKKAKTQKTKAVVTENRN